MKLVNLTKDVCRLYTLEGELIEIQPEAKHIGIVGIGEHQKVSSEEGYEISLNVQYVSEIKGMPPPEEGVMYIVPPEIAIALLGARDDIVIVAENASLNSLKGEVQRTTHLRRIISRMT